MGKKIKTLSLFIFGLLATCILGACSCGTKTISVLGIQYIKAQNEQTETVSSVEYTKVVAGDIFTLSYKVLPVESSNKKVHITTYDLANTSDSTGSVGSSVVQSSESIKDTGTAEGSVTFTAKSAGYSMVEFKTDDSSYTVTRRIHVYPVPSALTTPTNLVYNSTTNCIEWDSVTNATSYLIKINGEDYTTATNSYNISSASNPVRFSEGTEYNVQVKAQGDNFNYTNSESYTNTIQVYIIPKITTFEINNGAISWTAPTNANAYRVTYAEGKSVQITATSFDLKTVLDDIPLTNKFSFNVVALSTTGTGEGGLYYLSSAVSDTKTITKLVVPTNFALSGFSSTENIQQASVLSWTSVTSAVGYTISVDTDTEYSSEQLSNTFTIPDSWNSGKHVITITAVGNKETTISGADYSRTTYTFAKLPNLTTSVANNELIIDTTPLFDEIYGFDNDSAKLLHYEIYFTSNNVLVSPNPYVLTNALKINLSDLQYIAMGGSYKAYVKTVATANTNLATSTQSTTNPSPVTAFSKLNYSQVSKISKTGVLTLATIPNVESFSVALDSNSATTLIVPVTSDKVNISGDVTTIDLSFDTLNMSDITSGSHTILVYPQTTQNSFVDATLNSCNVFTFTKLAPVTSYTLDNINSVISWGDVTNSAYSFTFNGDTTVINTNSKTIVDPVTTNDFSIVALGNDRTQVNSDAYTFTISKLSQVSGVKVVDGVLEWDYNDNNIYYLTASTSGLTGTPVAISVNHYTPRYTGSYQVTLYRTLTGYFNSDVSSMYKISQLIAPTNITLNKATKILSWDAVTSATKYNVYVTLNGQTESAITVSTNSYTLPTLEAGSYTVKVCALGEAENNFDNLDNYAYLNSPDSTNKTLVKLPAPTITTNKEKLVWAINSTAIAGSYLIEISGEENVTTSNSQYDFASLDAGTYTIHLTSIASTADEFVLSSEQGAEYPITKLVSPTVRVTSGKIQWTNVVGSNGYIVQYSESGTGNWVVPTNNNNISVSTVGTVVNVTINNMSAGYLRFATRGNTNYITGNFGTAVQFQQMESVTNFHKTLSNFTWTPNTDSTGYMVTDTSGFYSEKIDSNSTSSVSVDMSTKTQGVYDYNIIALGSTFTSTQMQSNPVVYLESNPTTLKVVVLKTPINAISTLGVVSWNAYSSAITKDVPVSTFITINGTTTSGSTITEITRSFAGVSATSLDLNSLIENDSALSSGSYVVTIQYLGDGNEILSSTSATIQNIVKLENAIISVQAGSITFQQVTGASDYEVYVKQHSSSSWGTKLSSNQYTITGSTTKTLRIKAVQPDTSYDLKIVAIYSTGTGLHSNDSNTLQVQKLPTITTLSVENGYLQWDTITGAQSYTLYNGTSNTAITPDVTISEGVLVGKKPVSELNLAAGSYLFKIKANGSTSSGSDTISYLTSEFSIDTELIVVSQISGINISGDTISWEALIGVSAYSVELKSGETSIRTVTTQTNFVRLEQFSDYLTSGAYNSFVVTPVSVVDDRYIISNDNTELSIYKAPVIQNLRVIDGVFTWDLNGALALSYYASTLNKESLDAQDLTQLNSTINSILTNPSSVESDTYEQYAWFYSFELNINGVITQFNPKASGANRLSSDNCTVGLNILSGTLSVVFNYPILDSENEVVTTYTTYGFQVRSTGNSVESTDEAKLVVGGDYSNTLSAIKGPSPHKVTMLDGSMTFSLQSQVDVNGTVITTSYITDYTIIAVPSSSVDSRKEWDISISASDIVNGTYSYYLYDSNSSDQPYLQKNVRYSIYLYTRGTIDSTTLSNTDVIYLKSTHYDVQNITFYDVIKNFTYISSDNDIGGRIQWSPIMGTTQKVYMLLKSVYDGLDESGKADWINNTNTYVSDVETNYSALSFVKLLEEFPNNPSIPAGEYIIGIQAIGNRVDLIESSEIPTIYATKLPSVTKAANTNDSWVQKGRFVWSAVENCSMYRIQIVEHTLDGATNVLDSLSFAETYYELPDNIGADTSTFSLKITPIGKTANGIDYLSGYTIETSTYARVATPVLSFDSTTSKIDWDSITNASSYQLKLNGVIYPETGVHTNTQFVFNENEWAASSYSVQVRALTTSTNKLNGRYCESQTVTRLEDPILQVVNGNVSWEASTANIQGSGLVSINVYASSVNGEVGTLLKTISLLGSHSPYIDLLDVTDVNGNTLNLNSGYYMVEVQFINDPADSTWVLPSAHESIYINKLSTPVVSNGTYYEIGDTSKPEGLEFTNFIVWNQISVGDYKETHYQATIFDYTNDTQGATPLSTFDSVESPSYFTIIDNVVYFNVAGLSSSKVKIYVQAMGTDNGKTTADADYTISYTKSDSSNLVVEIPVNAPTILSTVEQLSSGVIIWNNEYTSDVEVYMAFTYNSYSGGSESLTKQVALHVEGDVAPTQYNLPYVAGDYLVKIRYVSSSYASSYSNQVGAAMTYFAYGSGTSTDPYIIYSDKIDETERNTTMQGYLSNIKYYPNAYYKLEDNVVLQSGWTTISSFGGNFDGNNKTISNIQLAYTQDTTNHEYLISMFKTFTSSAVFKNVTLSYATSQNITPTGIDTYTIYASGLVYTNNGLITDVSLTGSISIQGSNTITIRCGGVACINEAIKTQSNNIGIQNIKVLSSFTMSVVAYSEYVGGIAWTNNGYIYHSVMNGTLSSKTASSGDARLAGIAYSNVGTVDSCSFRGVMTSNNIGGIVYSNGESVTDTYPSVVNACSSIGQFNITNQTSGGSTISNTLTIGGVVGYMYGGQMNYCYGIFTTNYTLSVDTTNTHNIGGLIGYIASGTVTHSYAVLELAATNIGQMHVGIIYGNASTSGTISFANTFYYSTTPNASVGYGTAPSGLYEITDTSTLPVATVTVEGVEDPIAVAWLNTEGDAYEFVVSDETDSIRPYNLIWEETF